MAKVTERERSAILSSLASGVVPAIGLHHIQVGRKAEVEAIIQDLQRTAQGAAAVRFVVGRYGSGKSFFLNLVQTVALEKKFVVVRADITLDRRLQGTGGQARALYAELVRNLAIRGKPEGNALTSVVERWVSDIEHEVTSTGGKEDAVRARIVELCRPLQELVSGFDFANVLARYYTAYHAQDQAAQTAAVRWLRAEYATKTEARQDLGVRSIIDDDSFYDYLKLLAKFIRIAGYSGLLVCIDEVVVLSHRLNNRQARDRNYETILRIINDCLQGSVEGLGFLFAATDESLEDKRRGLFSYEALATRLAGNRFAKDGVVDLAGPVIKLASLTPEDCFVLLHNIRRVHERDDQSKRLLPDEAIEAYLTDCNRRMGAAYFQTPRDTIKDFVGLLSVLEQNPALSWKQHLTEIKTTAPASEETTVPDVDEAADSKASVGVAGAAESASPDDDMTTFKPGR